MYIERVKRVRGSLLLFFNFFVLFLTIECFSEEYPLNPESGGHRPKLNIDIENWSFNESDLQMLKKKHPKGVFVNGKYGDMTYFYIKKDGREITLGPVASWTASGKLSTLEYFDLKSGIRNGPVYNWYRDGGLRSVKHYTNGLMDGRSASWYENGSPKEDYADLIESNGTVKIREWHKNGTMAKYTYRRLYSKAEAIVIKIGDKKLSFSERYHTKEWNESAELTKDEMVLSSLPDKDSNFYSLLFKDGKRVQLEKMSNKDFRIIETIKFE